MSAATPVDLSTIPPEQLTLIQSQVRVELEKDNAIELAKLKDTLRMEYDTAFREELKKFEEKERKRRTPLTQEEIGSLLSKDYVTFEVKLIADGVEKIFTLSELPQKIEKEFYKMAKTTLETMVRDYGSFSIKDAQGDLLQSISELMELYNPIQEIMVKCCVLCLDPPKGKDNKKKYEWLDEEWIENNLTSFRIISILLAQVEVNKMRDFFSILFGEFQASSMIKKSPVDIQP